MAKVMISLPDELLERLDRCASEQGLSGAWTLVSGDLRDLVGPGLALAPDAALG